MSEEVIVEAVPSTEQEQTQTPEVVASPESGTEQTTQEVDTAPQEKPKNDWVQRRIDQLTREKYEEKRAREAAETQLREYQQPAEGTQPTTVPDVYKAAEQIVKQREFDAACNKVFESGTAEFPDFESSLKTFGMLGGATPTFLEAVTAMDEGHKVIHYLGQNPEAAEKLLSLPPMRMAMELTRIEAKLSKAPPVSRAPSPITPLGGKSAPVEPEEFGSTAEYIAWKKAHKK